MAEETAKQDAEAKDAPKVTIPEKLRKPFGLPAEMDGEEFAKAMEAIEQRKYAEIPMVREMTTPNATAYRDAVLNFGAESEEAADQMALLKKQVTKAITAAAADPETKKLLAENPNFKDMALSTGDVDKVTALVAAEMENQADLERGRLVMEARQRREENVKGNGESVAMADVAPPDGLPPKGKGPVAGAKKSGGMAA